MDGVQLKKPAVDTYTTKKAQPNRPYIYLRGFVL